jgi:hypothetical protein
MPYLQLAESGLSAAGRVCTCPDGFSGYCSSGDCSKCCSGRTTRQLSQGASDYYQHLAETDPRDLYVFVPTDQDGSGRWIREDYFDKFDDNAYEQIMAALEPYEDAGVSGLFSKMRERSQARRERRGARKDMKAESKATARVQRTQGGGALGKILDTVKQTFGGQKVDAGIDITSGKDPTGYFRTETEKPWYSKPVVIIGGIVLIGGTIYFLTRKKRA